MFFSVFPCSSLLLKTHQLPLEAFVVALKSLEVCFFLRFVTLIFKDIFALAKAIVNIQAALSVDTVRVSAVYIGGAHKTPPFKGALGRLNRLF